MNDASFQSKRLKQSLINYGTPKIDLFFKWTSYPGLNNSFWENWLLNDFILLYVTINWQVLWLNSKSAKDQISHNDIDNFFLNSAVTEKPRKSTYSLHYRTRATPFCLTIVDDGKLAVASFPFWGRNCIKGLEL